MKLVDRIIAYADAKKLEYLLHRCVICDSIHDHDNSTYFRKPICKDSKCHKIWNYTIPNEIKNYVKNYFLCIRERLDYDTLSEFINYSYYYLFSNGSMAELRPRECQITTKPQKYPSSRSDHLIVSESEYQEYFSMNGEYSYVYGQDNILVTNLYSNYYPYFDFIGRIKELRDEYLLKNKLITTINRIERNSIGYCKPKKYTITKLKPIKI